MGQHTPLPRVKGVPAVLQLTELGFEMSRCVGKRLVTLPHVVLLLAAIKAHDAEGGKRFVTVSVGHQRRPQWTVVCGESTRDGEYFSPMIRVDGPGAMAEAKRIGLGLGHVLRS